MVDVKPKQKRTCPASGKRIYANEGEAVLPQLELERAFFR